MQILYTLNEDQSAILEHKIEINNDLLLYIIHYIKKNIFLPRTIVKGKAAFRPLQIEGENIFYYEPLNEIKDSRSKIYTPIINSHNCTNYTEKNYAGKYIRIKLPEDIETILKLIFSIGNKAQITYESALNKKMHLERYLQNLMDINYKDKPTWYLEFIYRLLNCISIVDCTEIPLNGNNIARMLVKEQVSSKEEEDFLKALEISSYQLSIISSWQEKKDDIAAQIRTRDYKY